MLRLMSWLAVVLVFATLIVSSPVAAHQQTASGQSSDVALSVTAELLEPFDQDKTVFPAVEEVSSWHWATLSLASTSLPGAYADLGGTLYGDSTVSNTFILHVTQDDPETPYDESTMYGGFGLNTLWTIARGANVLKADSDGVVTGQGVAVTVSDQHTITGMSSGCL